MDFPLPRVWLDAMRRCAVLCRAVLCCAVLCCAVLRCAVLCCSLACSQRPEARECYARLCGPRAAHRLRPREEMSRPVRHSLTLTQSHSLTPPFVRFIVRPNVCPCSRHVSATCHATRVMCHVTRVTATHMNVYCDILFCVDCSALQDVDYVRYA